MVNVTCICSLEIYMMCVSTHYIAITLDWINFQGIKWSYNFPLTSESDTLMELCSSWFFLLNCTFSISKCSSMLFSLHPLRPSPSQNEAAWRLINFTGFVHPYRWSLRPAVMQLLGGREEDGEGGRRMARQREGKVDFGELCFWTHIRGTIRGAVCQNQFIGQFIPNQPLN